MDHNRACANLAVAADMNIAQDDGTCAHHHVITERRVAPATVMTGHAEGDSLIDHAIVTDDRRLSYHKTKAVVDNKAPSDGGRRMNVNPIAPTRALRKEDRETAQTPFPEPVLPPVGPNDVETRRKEYDVERGARARVAPEHRPHVFPRS